MGGGVGEVWGLGMGVRRQKFVYLQSVGLRSWASSVNLTLSPEANVSDVLGGGGGGR